MKKRFALLLAVLLAVSLVACGTSNGNGNETPQSEDTKGGSESDQPKETEAAEENVPAFTFTKFGKAKITLRGAEFKKDEDDENFLRVYYDYLNMDQTAAGHAPYLSVKLEITQNGEELSEEEFTADDEAHVQEDLFYNCAVQPGIPVRNTIIVYCNPEDGPVDVAMHVMVGSWAYNKEDVEWFKFQIDPQNMMPAPVEGYQIQPITAPIYAKDLPSSGTSTSASNPFSISLDGYELTTYDDAPALRVKMTYTHQHEWEMSPYTALTINAFQDGIALEQASTWYLDEPTAEDEAFEEDLATGETVACNAIFLLRNDNPVEVVVEQPLDDLRAGLVCNVK